MPSPLRVHVAYLHFGEKKTLIHATRYIDDVRGNGTRPGREPERAECDPRSDALHQDRGGHPRSAHRVRTGIKFGVAFCEASGPCLVRLEGNDESLKTLAAKNALAVGAGHFFVIFLKGAYPINGLRALRGVAEIVTVYGATADPVDVGVATPH